MSLINFFEDENIESKNDIFMSDFISNDECDPCKSFKDEFNIEKSSKDDMQDIIKNQFIKEMNDKNIISDGNDFNEDFSDNDKQYELFKNLDNIQSFSDGENFDYDDNDKYITPITHKNKNYQLSFNLNSKMPFSLSSDNLKNDIYNIDDKMIGDKSTYDNTGKKRIFKVVKIPRNKKQKVEGEEDILKKKRRQRRRHNRKGDDIDWDNIPVPKEKHFHLDRKKKRIVFQRKYLKMIYSIVDLEYPFDFNELFNLIKIHVGDKTVENYGNKKSFHIIKIKDELIIVTMKEKKLILKGSKTKK
jgi:hypothetical protein